MKHTKNHIHGSNTKLDERTLIKKQFDQAGGNNKPASIIKHMCTGNNKPLNKKPQQLAFHT